MSQNTAKIRLKIGQIEVEYEGNNAFLKDEIFQMLEKMSSFYAKHSSIVSPEDVQVDKEIEQPTSNGKVLKMAVGTIATRLNATSEAQMAMASAIHLTLVQGKETFSRKDIHDNMKKATGRFKKGMGHNLTSSLARLVNQERLNEVSDGRYALSEQEKDKMVDFLAKGK